MLARIATIATTTINSMRVKPLLWVDRAFTRAPVVVQSFGYFARYTPQGTCLSNIGRFRRGRADPAAARHAERFRRSSDKLAARA